MVLKVLFMCGFVCTRITVSRWRLFCACKCVCMREQERVVGSARSSVCQRSQSPGSLIPLPCGLENFLSSFPVLSPRWARRATPGKFMLMSAMKTPPPLYHVSQYLSNSSLSILSLSPLVLFFLHEYFHSY